MEKGLAVSTGIVIAGLMGSLTFVSTVPPAMMSFIAEGTSAVDTDDFDEFVSDLNEACNKDKQVSGGLSQYGSSIEFEGHKTVVLLEDSGQQKEEIDCPVKDHQDKVLEGTVSYVITKENGELVLQLKGI